MTIKEIYELKCNVCNKVITALSENQANYNLKAHELTHTYGKKPYSKKREVKGGIKK